MRKAFAVATLAAATRVFAIEPLTVEDSIRFETLSRPHSESTALHSWSPDRAHVALVSHTGNLERDEAVYRLWVYSAASLSDAAAASRPTAAPLLRMEAGTRRNRDAISDVTWGDDGRSLYFLRERGGARQVNRLDLATGNAAVLTNSPTDIVAFGVGGNRIVYSAEIPPRDLFAGGALVVASEPMPRLLGLLHERGLAGGPYRTYVQDPGREAVLLGENHEPQAADHMLPFVSPDGRWAITTRVAGSFPAAWRRYNNPNEAFKFATAADGSVPYWIRQFVLVDLEKRSVRPVLDAPLGWTAHFTARERALWLDGTPYVALVNTFLPLDSPSAEETLRREARPAIVLFDPSTGRFSRLMDIPGNSRSQAETQEVRDLRWRARERILEIHLRDRKTRVESSRWFRVDDRGSTEVAAAPSAASELELTLEQSYRMPPRLVTRLGAATVSLGPANEHLDGKSLDRVEPLEWSDRTGRKWQGGMYLPPGYDPSRRYPVVIQTYGFSPATFRLDGAPLTGYAARAIASEGIVVMQAPIDISGGLRTEGEVHRAMIEGLIDHLDARGIADRARVGLVGFSRTCYQVKYFLAHSKYPIRAASIADGIDFGYLQYVVASSPHRGDSLSASFELAYGGHPFGEARSAWLAGAPTFNAQNVTAAVRIFANNRWAILAEWEFYAALRKLSRPVELVALKDADHVPHLPRQRWIAQQGNVDWFRFWLKGEVDGAASKREQYQRWERLKALEKK